MKAYSTDLRERVVAACDARVGTREQIAARFSVSVAWVRKLLRLRRDTGSLDPKPHGGGRLRAVVRADPDAGGVPGSRPAGRHPEKKTRRAAEQDRPELKAERASWREEFAAIDPARLVFIDESGASTAMDRAHGGVRVDGPVPHGHWKVITLTAAIRLGGVPEAACPAFDGATDTAAFETYVGGCLAPTLRPGDIVVMDDLSCHKTAEAARQHGVLPRGLSFQGARQTMEGFRSELSHARPTEAEVLRGVAWKAIASHRVGDRPNRVEPRARKGRPKNYPLMHKPRPKLRKRLAKAA